MVNWLCTFWLTFDQDETSPYRLHLYVLIAFGMGLVVHRRVHWAHNLTAKPEVSVALFVRKLLRSLQTEDAIVGWKKLHFCQFVQFRVSWESHWQWASFGKSHKKTMFWMGMGAVLWHSLLVNGPKCWSNLSRLTFDQDTNSWPTCMLVRDYEGTSKNSLRFNMGSFFRCDPKYSKLILHKSNHLRRWYVLELKISQSTLVIWNKHVVCPWESPAYGLSFHKAPLMETGWRDPLSNLLTC